MEPLEAVHNFESPIRSFPVYRGKADDAVEAGVFKGNVHVSVLGPDEKVATAAADALAKSSRPSSSSMALLKVTRKDPADDALLPHYSATSLTWLHLPDKTPYEVVVRLYVVRYAATAAGHGACHGQVH